MANSQNHSLHDIHSHKNSAILCRTYTFLNIIAILAIFYYRASFFFYTIKETPLLPWLLIFVAEILLSIIWILQQPMYWWPVTRTVFPERLPEDESLPGIDVFICTADPNKEPTFDVMNTIISAICLDYPAQKLNVYLSDDGGAPVTLNGMKEAWVFATWWLPFCKRYNIKPICPKAYFEKYQEQSNNNNFVQDRNIVKQKYEMFKKRVHNWKVSNGNQSTEDHHAIIQVIHDGNVVGEDGPTLNPEKIKMPLLVYIAREKRPSYPHHFKAGALNVLLRISSILSNSPYILVLDCDMYCNDSISARNAMCFYVDSKISPSLAWVQFPQKYHNISESDIYDSQMRTTWHVLYAGMDGLQGPLLSGTNFYIKRKALYGFNVHVHDGLDVNNKRSTFGSSNELIKSLIQNDKPYELNPMELSSDYIKEAQFLSSCIYETDTQWGEKVGFRYHSVSEDVMTGLILHSEGWKSIYLNPKSPQFLGSATTNLNDTCVQGSRWTEGLLEIGLTRYSPLFYNAQINSILHKMFYLWICFFPLDFLPISCLAIIPPLCLFYGIPLYPKVSDPILIPYIFVFISSQLKQLFEVFLSEGSLYTWLNNQRAMMIKCGTSYAYGSIDCLMANLGIRKASFIPTNKAGDDDTTKWYQIGKYDFRTSNMFLIPIATGVTLNLFGFFGGFAKVIVAHAWDTFFAQVILSIYVLILSFPVIEGMFLRKDNARIPFSATLISTLLSLVLLGFGYLIMYY